MEKDIKTLAFLGAKEEVYENLESLRDSLKWSEQGMKEEENALYQELLNLIDQAGIMKTWADLDALVVKAKVLEKDIAAWHSMQGRTSLSFPWPKKPR